MKVFLTIYLKNEEIMKQIILKEGQEIEDINGSIYKINKGDVLLERINKK